MTEEKPILAYRTQVPSSKGGKEYTVSIFTDQSAVCSCISYMIQGVNRGNPAFQCKHIIRVMTVDAQRINAGIERSLAARRVEIKRAGRQAAARPAHAGRQARPDL